jgi:hypothetical protein
MGVPLYGTASATAALMIRISAATTAASSSAWCSFPPPFFAVDITVAAPIAHPLLTRFSRDRKIVHDRDEDPSREEDDVVVGSVPAEGVEVDRDENRRQAADREAQDALPPLPDSTSTRLTRTSAKTA